MQESVIYQDIKAEGIQEGLQEGIRQGIQQGIHQGIQKERMLILKQLHRKVGEVPESEKQKIQQLSPDQLENLGEALLDFSSLEDLSTWLRELA
ncbi:MAG: DUF4351 domain-containing protein, partial [Cyanobacteria bacterium J06635_1]